MIALLGKHSSVRYVDLRAFGPALVIVGVPEYAFGELKIDGRRLQSKCSRGFRDFCELIEILLQHLSGHQLRQFNDSKKVIWDAIKQSTGLWDGSLDSLKNHVEESFVKILGLIDQLHDPSAGTSIFVPDTNALLTNPNLEGWRFPNVAKFELLILPTVLKELDDLKTYHKNDDVKKKAKGIISRFKEYRRRGSRS